MQDQLNSRLARLDLSLLSTIPTQSVDDDRRSWLAVQRSIRADGYHYLEIGSYLGGSVQQHLVDPQCLSIVSIDNRPFDPPDARNHPVEYDDNSTEGMLARLRVIDAGALAKITTFECDASKIDPAKLPAPPDFCFIDGEHTQEAVISDFNFCLKVCSPDAAICLHDARIIHPGIKSILSSLEIGNIKFSAGRLPGDTFGIFLRNCPVVQDPFIRPHLGDASPFFRHMRARHFFKALLPRGAHSAIRRIFPAP